MRDRKKQRALRRAGIRKEEPLGRKNEEQYVDLTPYEAVGRIVKGRKHAEKRKDQV